MPDPQAILDGLEIIANSWRVLAVVWHVLLGAVLVGLLRGWRPHTRLFGALVALPLLSVSGLSWLAGNPFNGTTFAVIGLVALGLALRLPSRPIEIADPGLLVPGALLVGFGWAYPHFLETRWWVEYLYASPFGLVPCPTLSVTIGLALMTRGLGARVWSLLLASAGVFYGLFGWLRLGVAIDVALLAGGSILAAFALSRRLGGREGSVG